MTAWHRTRNVSECLHSVGAWFHYRYSYLYSAYKSKESLGAKLLCDEHISIVAVKAAKLAAPANNVAVVPVSERLKLITWYMACRPTYQLI